MNDDFTEVAASSRPASGSLAGSRPGTGALVANDGTFPHSRPTSDTSLRSRREGSRPGTGASQGSWLEQALEEVEDTDAIDADADAIDKAPPTVVVVDTPPTSRRPNDAPQKARGRSCWELFSNCLRGMWSTREMNVSEDREVYVRTTIRELVIYCLFILTLGVITFGMTSATMYHYTQIMKGLFGSSEKVSDVASLWKFLEGDFLDSLYFEYKYSDGEAKNFICPGGDSAVGPCPVAPTDRNILYENRLLGVPRLRQLRVTNHSCELHHDIQKMTAKCFGEYSPALEDKFDFGAMAKDVKTIRNRTHTAESAWTYNTSEALNGVDFSGFLATYSGGGSFQDLSSYRNETVAMMKELKEGTWITRGTRFISIDFTVYNANINYFCIIKIVFELPATGGVIPTLQFQTAKLLRYVTPQDYFVMACEFIFCVFIVYYIVEEIIEIKRHRVVYFSNIYNVLDVLVITVAIMNVGFTIYTFFKVEQLLGNLLANPDKFADFNTLGFWASRMDNVLSICIFFSWIKFFKYISFNKTMTQLSSTLQRSSSDLAGFGVMFAIVFVAFAQSGYLLFWTHIKDYSTFTDAIFTLLRIILGDFDFYAIQDAEPWLGPLYFTAYVLVVFFILLNMFLAIINDTYTEVKAEIAARKVKYEMGDYFMRGYNNILGKIGQRDSSIDIENALKMTGADGIVTYEEFRQNLKKVRFSDLEIEMFFAKHDKNGVLEFNAGDADDLLSELDEYEYDADDDDADGADGADLGGAVQGSADDAAGKVVTEDQLLSLIGRVNQVEEHLGEIIHKIDCVFSKMSNMEQEKAHMRDAMDQIFDPSTPEEELGELANTGVDVEAEELAEGEGKVEEAGEVVQ